MKTLQEFATEIREVNAMNGWGLTFDPTAPREVPGYVGLIHSEITEAYKASRPGEVASELGDVIVRCLDLGELLQPGCWDECSPEYAFPGNDHRASSWESDLLELHSRTSQALEVYRKVDEWQAPFLTLLHVTVTLAWWMIGRYTPLEQPEEVLNRIIAKNRTRGYRHGGRRT